MLFSQTIWMDEVHVHIMFGIQKFSENLEAISKTYVSEE